MLTILVTRSQNQRQKGMKVKLVVRTWLVLAVSVWMVYQLRLFLNHKLSSSENGSSIKEDTQFEELKLGRKGLLLVDSEKIKPDNKEEDKDKAMEEENSELKQENQEEVEVEEQSGDGDDEDLDTVRFDDPMEEIDSLNNDNDDDEKIDQQSDEEDDGTLMKGNEDKVDGNENDSLESVVTVR